MTTTAVQTFLSDNSLTEFQFEKILNEVLDKNSNLKLMILHSPYGWRGCNIKILERILDIYDNSNVDLSTGKILTVNFS